MDLNEMRNLGIEFEEIAKTHSNIDTDEMNNLGISFELEEETSPIFEQSPLLDAAEGKDLYVPGMATEHVTEEPRLDLVKYRLGVPASESEVGKDIAANVENVRAKYSTLAKQIGGYWDEDMKQEAATEIKSVKDNILSELKSKGIQAKFNEDGDLFAEIDGQEQEITPGILKSIWKSKFETGGAISGAIAGGKIGSRVPGGPLAKGIGTVAGTIVGSMAGASSGRGLDIMVNQIDLVNKLSDDMIVNQMKEAGVFDVVAGAFGTVVVKGIQHIGRTTKRIFNLVADGNKEGAVEYAMSHFGVTKEQALDAVNNLEEMVGPLQGNENDKILEALIRTNRGGEGVILASEKFNPAAGANIANDVINRADDLLVKSKELSTANLQGLIKTELGKYIDNVGNYYEDVKQSGIRFTEGFEFDFDATGISPAVESIGNRIENPTIKKRFLANLETIKSTSEGRDFNSLLELKQAVNKMQGMMSKSATKSDRDMMKSIKASVDKEIDRAADLYIPNSKVWKDQWKKANEEYGRMKMVQSNIMYKALTRRGVDEESVVKSLMKYVSAGDDTFFEVVDKLPRGVRNRIDGTILNQLVEKYAAGTLGANRAIHFPLLSQEINKVKWSSPKAKQQVRTINRMAEVFKNDVNLAKVSGKIMIPSFQSYLTTDPVVRLKFEMASKMFNYVKQLPNTEEARAIALAKVSGNILNNPLNSKSIKDLYRGLPKDKRNIRETLDFEPILKDLQNEFLHRKQKLQDVMGRSDIPPRLVWIGEIPNVEDVLYATSGGVVSKDAKAFNPSLVGSSSELLKSVDIYGIKARDIILDHIARNATDMQMSAKVMEDASDIIESSRLRRNLRNISGEIKHFYTKKQISDIVDLSSKEADFLINAISRDTGVTIPKDEAQKIIMIKFNEMIQDIK